MDAEASLNFLKQKIVWYCEDYRTEQILADEEFIGHVTKAIRNMAVTPTNISGYTNCITLEFYDDEDNYLEFMFDLSDKGSVHVLYEANALENDFAVDDYNEMNARIAKWQQITKKVSESTVGKLEFLKDNVVDKIINNKIHQEDVNKASLLVDMIRMTCVYRDIYNDLAKQEITDANREALEQAKKDYKNHLDALNKFDFNTLLS